MVNTSKAIHKDAPNMTPAEKKQFVKDMRKLEGSRTKKDVDTSKKRKIR